MAPRAQWKGYLKLSLVSCAVALFPAATTSARTQFHTLNKSTGNRVRRQFIDAETGDPVTSENQERGYEVAKQTYIVVSDEELDQIALESTHTIDIDRFVARSKVDQRFLEQPYYLAPDDNIAQQAFAIIRDAMQQRNVVGIARVVLYRRERLLLLEPYAAGMLATVLRYKYEVREEKPYFQDIVAVDMPSEMLDLATHIIDQKTGDFDLTQFEDRYENALIEIIREKQKGEPVRRQPAVERPSNVVNLMEALRLSLGGGGAQSSQKQKSVRKPEKPAARRAAGTNRKSGGRAQKSRIRKAS